MARQRSRSEDHLATAVWGLSASAAEDAAAPASRVSPGSRSAGDREDGSPRLVAQLCCGGETVVAGNVLRRCVQPWGCSGVAFSFYADFTVSNAIFSFPFQNSYKHVFFDLSNISRWQI